MTASSTNETTATPVAPPAMPAKSDSAPTKAPSKRQTALVTNAEKIVPPKAPAKRITSPSVKQGATSLAKSVGSTEKVKATVNTVTKPVTKTEHKEMGTKQPTVAKKPVTTKSPAPKSGKSKAAPRRAQKVKMVRDSFTFPENEHKQLIQLKKRLIALGTEVKKGELVRAGFEILFSLEDSKLIIVVTSVEKLKTGRPKK
jgi:hypothetical protein